MPNPNTNEFDSTGAHHVSKPTTRWVDMLENSRDESPAARSASQIRRFLLNVAEEKDDSAVDAKDDATTDASGDEDDGDESEQELNDDYPGAADNIEDEAPCEAHCDDSDLFEDVEYASTADQFEPLADQEPQWVDDHDAVATPTGSSFDVAEMNHSDFHKNQHMPAPCAEALPSMFATPCQGYEQPHVFWQSSMAFAPCPGQMIFGYMAVAYSPMPAMPFYPNQSQEQPNVLTASPLNSQGAVRITWSIASKRLKCGDVLSPQFHVQIGASKTAAFKIMVKPKQLGMHRQRQSFKKSKGVGSIEIKCVSSLSKHEECWLQIRLAIGVGGNMATKALLHHNFGTNSVARLPEPNSEWDLWRAIDSVSQTTSVTLELVPVACTSPQLATMYSSEESMLMGTAQGSNTMPMQNGLSQARTQRNQPDVQPKRHRRSAAGHHRQHVRHLRRLAARADR